MNKNNRKKKGLSKRVLALMLCCFCLLATIPISAFALETGETQITEESISEQKAENTGESLLSLSSETSESQTETDAAGSETETEELSFCDQLMAAESCQDIFNLMMSDTDACLMMSANELAQLKEKVNTMEDDGYQVDVLDTIAYLEEQLSGCNCGAAEGEDHDTSCPMYEASTYATIHYYHFDFRIAANITVKVYNADGTTTETTVTGTVSDPTAVIYNTSGVTWSSYDGETTDEVKYKNVTFDNNTSTDSSTGELEYASTVGHGKGSDLEFYEGDTLVLTYKLTYTLNGEEHTVSLTQSVVTDNDNNACGSKDKDGDMRGFDIVVSAEDITAAMNTSVMQISKIWNDNNQSGIRPDSIIVNIAQDGDPYLILTLNNAGGSYAMAPGVTEPDDLTVAFSNGYGATINGLPQNTWDFSGDSPTFVSHEYTVSEVSQVAKEGLEITPVYGSDVSYSPDADKYEYQVYLTNTLAYETLAVKKKWEDSDSSISHTNDSVTVKLSATYSGGTVPDDWLADFLGTTTFTLNDANGWYLQMGQMPVYYTKSSSEVYQITGFHITETSATIDGTTYDCEASDVGESGYTWNASGISTSKDENGNYYITVTNSNAPQTTSVTISKTVGGNMGDQSKEFAFTATLSGEGYTFEGVTYSIDGGESKSAGNGTTCNFTLKHGQSITFTGLPIGATFTVTETSYSGYVTTVDGVSGNSKEITLAETNSNIAFVNTKDVTIDTGVLLDTLPYILILGVVVVGAVLLIKKRRNRDDD